MMARGAVTIHPQEVLEPGLYLLDDDGRLQPLRYRGFVRAVAAVTVRAKVAAPPASPTPLSAPSAAPEPTRHDEVMDEFKAALERVQDRKGGTAKQRPKIDYARLSDAMQTRRVHAAKPVPKPRPTVAAQTRESCPDCGIPGFRGCDHFLPFEPRSPL